MDTRWYCRVHALRALHPTPRPRHSRQIATRVAAQDVAFQRPRLQPVTGANLNHEVLPQAALRKLKYPYQPNAHTRSPIHNINLSSRLGVRLAQPVVGAQEWQTSTYHFNKATSKNFPVAAQITNKLLESYVALEPQKLDPAGNPIPARKAQIQARRLSNTRNFVSESTVKDFGNKVVINAFVYQPAPYSGKRDRSSGRKPKIPGESSMR